MSSPLSVSMGFQHECCSDVVRDETHTTPNNPPPSPPTPPARAFSRCIFLFFFVDFGGFVFVHPGPKGRESDEPGTDVV